MNEHMVINRAKQGDQRAFETLVTEYEQKVYSLAYHYVGSEQDAMDICQEVFLRVYRFLPQFSGESRFSTWLYRVTSNACKDFLRKKGSRMEVSLSQEGEEEDYTPENVLEQKEMRRQIEESLHQLSPDHREILVMRDVLGLSYEEIANSLDLEEGTVKSRISRAREKLRIKLTETGNFFGKKKSKGEKGGKP